MSGLPNSVTGIGLWNGLNSRIGLNQARIPFSDLRRMNCCGHTETPVTIQTPLCDY